MMAVNRGVCLADSRRVEAAFGPRRREAVSGADPLRGQARTAAPLNAVGATSQTLKDVKLVRYLASLSKGRLILWCYFIWYVVVLIRYFDPSPRLWFTSLGLSLIIGFALYVSTTAAGDQAVKLERWQVIRLFMMPFCVSSFAALVKGRGFFLIFSPNIEEILLAVGLCAVLCGAVALLKRRRAAPGVANP